MSGPDLQAPTLRVRDTSIELPPRALVMGVLNVTPDSFSDGGCYSDPEAALARACAMVDEGADLIDIGAESSRPGSDPIPADEEMRRLLPVVEAVARKVSVPISIDTTKAAVARRALDLGAGIINDISGLRFDAEMAEVVAGSGAGVVLMHMQGMPKTMQEHPVYHDLVAEVYEFLQGRIEAARSAGIGTDQILLDPGIGFGKTVDHNLALLARLGELAALPRPLVVGVSRKAFIGQVLGNKNVGERLMGTAAAVAVAVQQGARIIRVHDVAAMRDVVTMLDALAKAAPGVVRGLH